MSLAVAVLHWFPVDGHPHKTAREPWYAVNSRYAFRTHAHFEGQSLVAHFRLTGDAAYPTEHHPLGPSDLRWFVFRGSMIYPAEGHPHGTSLSPWYQAR